MRKTIIAALLFSAITAAITGGCSTMTSQQRADVLTGLEIVAAGVAAMPGADPAAQYWARYAAGVLGGRGGR